VIKFLLWLILAGMYLALSVLVFNDLKNLPRKAAKYKGVIALSTGEEEIDPMEFLEFSFKRILITNAAGFALAAVAAFLSLLY